MLKVLRKLPSYITPLICSSPHKKYNATKGLSIFINSQRYCFSQSKDPTIHQDNLSQILKQSNTSVQQHIKQLQKTQKQCGKNSKQYSDALFKVVMLCDMDAQKNKNSNEDKTECYALEMYELAKKYPQIKKINPQYEWVQLKLGKFYYKKHNYKQAKKYYDEFILNNPQFTKQSLVKQFPVFQQIILVNLNTKNNIEALKNFRIIKDIIIEATEKINSNKLNQIIAINKRFGHLLEYAKMQYLYGEKEVATQNLKNYIKMLGEQQQKYLYHLQLARSCFRQIKNVGEQMKLCQYISSYIEQKYHNQTLDSQTQRIYRNNLIRRVQVWQNQEENVPKCYQLIKKLQNNLEKDQKILNNHLYMGQFYYDKVLVQYKLQKFEEMSLSLKEAFKYYKILKGNINNIDVKNQKNLTYVKMVSELTNHLHKKFYNTFYDKKKIRDERANNVWLTQLMSFLLSISVESNSKLPKEGNLENINKQKKESNKFNHHKGH